MTETQNATPTFMLHVPGRGLCSGTLAVDLTARGATDGYRWLVFRLSFGPPVVVQVERYDVGRWPRERATAWWLPQACEPIEERLREATDPARVLALLGAGTGGTWLLYDEDVDLGLDPDPDDWPPARWRRGAMGDVPDGLAAAALRVSGARAAGHRVELELGDFDPLAVSTAAGGYEHNGVEVVGWEAVRLVAAALCGGEAALLVAEVRATEAEDFDALLAQDHVTLRIVPRAGAADAEPISLAHDPGVPLRPSPPADRPPVAETTTANPER